MSNKSHLIITAIFCFIIAFIALFCLIRCAPTQTCLIDAISTANKFQCKDKLLFVEGNGFSERHVQLWILVYGRYYVLTGLHPKFIITDIYSYDGYMEKVKGWKIKGYLK